ncbi:MAG: GIDE domain-containing protein [Pseudomonadota bacterium]
MGDSSMGEMLLYGCGGFCLLIALLLFVNERSERHKLKLILQDPPATPQEVITLHERLQSLLDKDEFGTPMEFSGVLEIESGLTAPVTQQTCAYYYCEVTRVYLESESREEKVVWQRDDHQNFYLRGEEGRVCFRLPEDASFLRDVATETYQKTFQEEKPDLPFSDVGEPGEPVGYEIEEHALIAGTRLYVYAEALVEQGEVVLIPPSDGADLILTTQTKREVINGFKETIKVGKWLNPSLVVIGAALIFWGWW